MVMRVGHLQVRQMVCAGCEDIINRAVKQLSGVVDVKADYARQQVEFEYDDSKVSIGQIRQAIEAAGYPVVDGIPRTSGIGYKLLMFLLLLVFVGGVVFWGKSQMPEVMRHIKPQMDDVLLLSVGFLTGFHCIGMCGGFVVAYTDKHQSQLRQLSAHLSYGFGKALSYTTLGAGFGLLGASIAITPTIRGIATLAASAFLMLYGLKMLNVFQVLRRLTLRLPPAANWQITTSLQKRHNPLLTGLLTGLLLGCGPLQAMYVMAAGSGDPLQGARILFLFNLGTLLPLLGFGVFASLLSAKAMHQLVLVSGILILVMGIMMANRGLAVFTRMNPMPTNPASVPQPSVVPTLGDQHVNSFR